MSDVVEGYRLLTEAGPAYERAHRYYSGEVAEVFSTPTLRRLLRDSGERFKMNVIRSVVNSVADRLDVLAITVDGATTGEPGSSGVSPVQARLNEIVKANGLAFEAPTIMRRACEYGDAYVMVWPDDDGDSDPVLPVVVNYLPPTSCRVVYEIDNPRAKRYAVHAWLVKGTAGVPDTWRANLLYADRVERWTTVPGAKPEEAAGWDHYTPNGDPEEWVIDNPYGEVPVFHFRNGTPYGEPEHLHGYGAQDAVNKIVIAHMSTIDFHVAPQRYAIADAAGAGSGDPDEFDLDDFDDTQEPVTVEERRARKGIKSGPGELWLLESVKSVGEFSAASASNFIEPATFYLKMLAQTTDTPLHMVDDSADEPSGESRRRKEAPLTEKVRSRAGLFAAVWGDLYTFALKVAGFPGRTVSVSFAPAEVVSDAEGWSTIRAKIEAGVPVRQALTEAGYTTTQVDEWFPVGEENSFRVADLVQVADILQKIGAAVAMGIVTAEEGRAMLPEGILPEGAPTPGPVELPPPTMPPPVSV